MDASWQSKLLRPTLQQHEMACNSPSAAAARSLAGLQASGFDPSQLQWGMGRCYEGSAPGMNLAAAGLPGLQGLSAAQALALLCTPLYAAAAERQYQHQSVLEAAAAAAAAGHAGGLAAAAARSGGGVAAASGDRGAAGRSKSSRRAAPSVNSGSTGPPLGAKRALEAAGDEEGMPAKKVRVFVCCCQCVALAASCDSQRYCGDSSTVLSCAPQPMCLLHCHATCARYAPSNSWATLITHVAVSCCPLLCLVCAAAGCAREQRHWRGG